LCENLSVKLTSIDNDVQRRALSRILSVQGRQMVKEELSCPSFSRPTAQIGNRLTQLRRGKGPIGVARVQGEALKNHFLLRAAPHDPALEA
jgi:hypothetical protein